MSPGDLMVTLRGDQSLKVSDNEGVLRASIVEEDESERPIESFWRFFLQQATDDLAVKSLLCLILSASTHMSRVISHVPEGHSRSCDLCVF